jgi:hypothetical protein
MMAMIFSFSDPYFMISPNQMRRFRKSYGKAGFLAYSRFAGNPGLSISPFYLYIANFNAQNVQITRTHKQVGALPEFMLHQVLNKFLAAAAVAS